MIRQENDRQPGTPRRPADAARRRTRALEAFMSQQVLALARTGTAARRRLEVRGLDGSALAGYAPRQS